MAAPAKRLRPRSHRPTPETWIRFDEDTGFVLRRTRLYDDGQLASESFVAYPAGA